MAHTAMIVLSCWAVLGMSFDRQFKGLDGLNKPLCTGLGVRRLWRRCGYFSVQSRDRSVDTCVHCRDRLVQPFQWFV